MDRIAAAFEIARADVRAGTVRADGDGRARTRHLAIGDPQAPFERFLAILDGHGALGDDGRLRPDVHLVTMGDHFDWGTRDERARATDDALALLAWLAAHPADQATLIAGNHDLARVGEMAAFDDDSFGRARAEADLAYVDGKTDEAAEKRLLEKYPDVPTTECLARDFAAFSPAQRTLVVNCIAAKRLRVAFPVARDFLLCHAGVTLDELDVLGVPESARADAFAIAASLNGALDEAFAEWDGKTPFAIRGLHRPGNARDGEARGMFFHRPSNPDHEEAALFAGPPRRRFDPRRLPPGLSQAIGHIRDNKCRRLLEGWNDGAAATDGPLRILETDGVRVRYRAGTATAMRNASRVYFTDGGMSHAEPSRYELLDLATRAAATRVEGAFVRRRDDIGSAGP